jgi:hypothetical protein
VTGRTVDAGNKTNTTTIVFEPGVVQSPLKNAALWKVHKPFTFPDPDPDIYKSPPDPHQCGMASIIVSVPGCEDGPDIQKASLHTKRGKGIRA